LKALYQPFDHASSTSTAFNPRLKPWLSGLGVKNCQSGVNRNGHIVPGSFDERTDIADKIAGNRFVVCFCNLGSRFLFHILTPALIIINPWVNSFPDSKHKSIPYILIGESASLPSSVSAIRKSLIFLVRGRLS